MAEPELATGAATERRIAWLTLLFGFAASAVLAVAHQEKWAVGLAIGTALGWLNFRWLKRALDALVLASKAQEGRQRTQVPVGTYFTAVFRYGLLALSVYVIFKYFHVPVGSIVVGLCALGAATIAASVWEILHPVD